MRARGAHADTRNITLRLTFCASPMDHRDCHYARPDPDEAQIAVTSDFHIVLGGAKRGSHTFTRQDIVANRLRSPDP